MMGRAEANVAIDDFQSSKKGKSGRPVISGNRARALSHVVAVLVLMSLLPCLRSALSIQLPRSPPCSAAQHSRSSTRCATAPQVRESDQTAK